MKKIVLDKLEFRRQYISGPESNIFPGWNFVTLPGGRTIAAHPDLQLTDYEGKNFRLILLGYILNPYHPTQSNFHVLSNIDETSHDYAGLCEQLYDKSGHYVLFAIKGANGIVLNDVGGLKQVYYYLDPKGQTWFTSHASILSKHLNLPFDEEALHYTHSEKYKKKLEPWFPTDTSPYTGVKRLVPNHYLDINTLSQTRFWPVKKLKHYSLVEGTRQVGNLIKGASEAGHNRFPVAVSLTGGYDSRVVLAGCRDFAQDIEVFTMIYRHLSEKSEDLLIASQIAREMNLKYHYFKCNQEIPTYFVNLYQQNTEGYKTDWMNLVYARYTNIPQEKVVYKGNLAEAIRCDFWPDGIYPVEVTVQTLVEASCLGNDPFIYNALEKWMREAESLEKYNYRLLDLFALEVEAGSWQAMSHSIFGIAHEEYSPFANRKLLDISLGVHKRYRSWPKIQFEQEIVKYLWPELANFPYYSSWSMHGYKKKFYDGDLLNFFRKVRHNIKRRIK